MASEAWLNELRASLEQTEPHERLHRLRALEQFVLDFEEKHPVAGDPVLPEIRAEIRKLETQLGEGDRPGA